jgi:nucleoside-diphosphate-sugar epimerase
MRLLIFGYGFTGRALARLRPAGIAITGVARSADTREAMTREGVTPLDPDDGGEFARALADADGLLVAAPPDAEGCPGLRATGSAGLPPWVGYLSTTGVYGDRRGGWVFEETAPAPASPEAQRRVQAEQDWRTCASERLFVFRLPGIYGPGRSALDRVRAGEARRVVKPGHVFSRVHVDDIATGVLAALQRPERGGVYNLCDDQPAPAADVTLEACRLLGVPPPPEQPFDPDALSPMARRFWSENRRVANAKAKAALGWRPAYPTYREGLAAIAGPLG